MIEAAFASITAAVLFVGLTIVLTTSAKFDQVESLILGLVLGMLSVAAICWLFSLEQLSEMLSPSVPDDMFVNLYMEAMDLWVLGLVLLIAAVCYFLVLLSAAIAVGIGIMVVFVAVRHFRVLHGW